jgi:hypothetical protein
MPAISNSGWSSRSLAKRGSLARPARTRWARFRSIVPNEIGTPALFADAVNSAKATLKRVLAADPYQPAVIVADSKDEALAFLSAAFAPEDPEFGAYRDRIIVFREAGALSKLATRVTNFIPVIVSREVEKEFAPFRSSMPSFIVYPRNATNAEPDIVLETLNWETFNKALIAMGLDKDRVDQLARESGRSPTVLRRRLSRLPAIRTPDWRLIR